MTKNRQPGRRRIAWTGASKEKAARMMAAVSMPMNKVVRAHERFRIGLALAVRYDISHERPKKRHQATGLNFSLRRVVSRSTTNWFSLFSIISAIRNFLVRKGCFT